MVTFNAAYIRHYALVEEVRSPDAVGLKQKVTVLQLASDGYMDVGTWFARAIKKTSGVYKAIEAGNRAATCGCFTCSDCSSPTIIPLRVEFTFAVTMPRWFGQSLCLSDISESVVANATALGVPTSWTWSLMLSSCGKLHMSHVLILFSLAADLWML